MVKSSQQMRYETFGDLLMENMLRSEAKAWKRRGVMVAQWHGVCIWGIDMILSILAISLGLTVPSIDRGSDSI